MVCKDCPAYNRFERYCKALHCHAEPYGPDIVMFECHQNGLYRSYHIGRRQAADYPELAREYDREG